MVDRNSCPRGHSSLMSKSSYSRVRLLYMTGMQVYNYAESAIAKSYVNI